VNDLVEALSDDALAIIFNPRREFIVESKLRHSDELSEPGENICEDSSKCWHCCLLRMKELLLMCLHQTVVVFARHLGLDVQA
jgi:hypothetical protein